MDFLYDKLKANQQSGLDTLNKVGYYGNPANSGWTAPESWNRYAEQQAQTRQPIVAGLGAPTGFWGGVANTGSFLYDTVKGIGTGAAKTLTAGLDIGQKTIGNPLASLMETMGGVDTVKDVGKTGLGSRFMENLIEKTAEQTNYEKFFGKNLADPNKGVIENILTNPDARDFIASAVEAPLYIYGGGKGIKTLLNSGTTGTARVMGSTAIGASTGFANTVPQTIRKGNLNGVVGDAVINTVGGAVLGAGTAGLGEGVRAVVGNVKLNKFIDTLKLPKDVSKTLNREQKLQLLMMSNQKVSNRNILKTANQMAKEVEQLKLNKAQGVISTGNGKSVDELVNKVKEAYAKLPDIGEARKIAQKSQFTRSEAAKQKILDSGGTQYQANQTALAAASGKFNLDKKANPLSLSTRAKEDISILIESNLTNQGEKYSATQAFNELMSGIIPDQSRLDTLSRAINYDMNKVTKIETGMDKVLNMLSGYGNFKRSLMASGDISGAGRQAFPLVAKMALTHPVELGRIFKNSLKYVADKAYYESSQLAHMKDPLFKELTEMGLKYSRVNAKVYGAGEEIFTGGLAEKTPIIKSIVNPSERQYVGFLNDLRMYEGKRQYGLLKGAGFNPSKDQKVYSEMMGLVNNATGAGKLTGKLLKEHASSLNALMFSPQLIASRISYLNPLKYNPASPVGRERISQLASMIIVGMGVVKLAESAGAKVEWDPRSTAFAKAQFGNSSIDFLGGFQPYVRFAAQQMTGQVKSSTGKISTMDATFGGPTRLGSAVSFARGKLNPLAADVTDLYTGTNAIGENISLPDVAVRGLSPLAWQDTIEAIKANPEAGPLFGVGMAGSALIGFGMNTNNPDDRLAQKAKDKEINTLKKTNPASYNKYRLTGIK